MNTTTETVAEPWNPLQRDGFTLAMGRTPQTPTETPPGEDWRGTCPDCGHPAVASLYYHPVKGYLLRYNCWNALRQHTEGIAFPWDMPCDWYSVS